MTNEIEFQMKNSDKEEIRARAWLFKVQCSETDLVLQICHQPAAEHQFIQEMRLNNNDEKIVHSAKLRVEHDTTSVTVYSGDGFMSIQAKHYGINFQEPQVWIDRSYIRSSYNMDY